MIYLDSASTTSLNPEILSLYNSLLAKHFANSESLYDAGVEVNKLIEKSRASLASFFNVRANEVIFTSCASESNTTLIKGIAFANQKKGKHIITSCVEHSSIMNCCKQMEEVFGYEVTYLPVNKDGVVEVESLKKALRADTVLVSIMAVNNESGAIMPIDELKKIVKKSNAYFHVDCVQALGKIDIDMTDIDCASFSAHKIHGLKGSAFFIKKQHVPMISLINGGQQEMGYRGGTANSCVDIVLAKTVRLALAGQKKEMEHISSLNKALKAGLSEIEEVTINSSENAIANIVNFSVKGLTSEVMMNAFNAKGICVSAQSTCSSKSDVASHVLLAMGLSENEARRSIRISFDGSNTIEEVNYFIEVLKETIKAYGTNRV